MANIFISHSSRNSDRAIEVQNWLKENGWDDVFLDLDPERGIVAGQRWKEALQKAAHRCELVLALVSPEWLASSWCKSEIDAARLMGKKIIVALIGSFCGILRQLTRILLGERKHQDATDARQTDAVPSMALLLGTMVVFSVWLPQPLLDVMHRAAAIIGGQR